MTKELEVVEHESSGNEKLLSQYKDSPIFGVLLDTFTSKLNEFEEQVTKFKTELTINTAVGVNLDLIGDILNSPTRPVDDERFREVLFGLVAAYNSEGRASDLLTIIRKLIVADEYLIFDGPNPATFQIILTGAVIPADPSLVISLIDLSKSLGVKFDGLTINPAGFLPIFAFESDGDGDAGPFALVLGGEVTSMPYVFSPPGLISAKRLVIFSFNWAFVTADDAEGIAFKASIDTFVATSNNEIIFTDSNGAPWTITSNESSNTTETDFGDALHQQIPIADNTVSLEWYGNFVNPDDWQPELGEYFDDDQIAWENYNKQSVISNIGDSQRSFYSFVMAPVGAMTETDRIRVVLDGTETRIEVFMLVSDNPSAFLAEINGAIANGGVFELVDEFLSRYKIIFNESISSVSATFVDFTTYWQINIPLDDNGTLNGTLLSNDSTGENLFIPVSPAGWVSGWSTWDESNLFEFDKRNVGHPIGGIISGNRKDVASTLLPYDPAYPFPASGVLVTSQRILVEEISTDVFSLTIYVEDGTGDTFVTEMLSRLATSADARKGNYLVLVDAAGVKWGIRNIDLSVTVTVSSSDKKVAIVFDSSGTIKAEIYRDGLIVLPSTLVSDFVPYTQADAALYATNNPNGLLLNDPTLPPFRYHEVYKFEPFGANADTDRFVVYNPDANNQGITIFLEYNRGRVLHHALIDFDKVGGYFELVDRAGVRWTFTSLGGFELPIYGTGAGSRKLDLRFRKDGAEAATVTKDGVPVLVSVFISDFSGYDDTQEAEWDTNNPFGIIRDRVLNVASNDDAGYYSLLLT